MGVFVSVEIETKSNRWNADKIDNLIVCFLLCSIVVYLLYSEVERIVQEDLGTR